MSRRDKTEAEALRIAVAYLNGKGWKYTPYEIGETAKQIMNGLDT